MNLVLTQFLIPCFCCRKATRLWNSFDIHIQLEIRQAVLQRLSHEKEKYVQHAVMEIIGAIAKQEFFSDRNWPELMVFVEKNLRNGDLKQKEVCKLLFANYERFNIV